MFPKVVLLVIAVGAGACVLLAMRQSRLQVASELAQSQLRVCEADERLWLLRSQVASAVTPQSVERLARALGPMKPIRDGLPASALAGVPTPEAAQPGAGPPSDPVASGSRVAKTDDPARGAKPPVTKAPATKPKSGTPARAQPAGSSRTTRVAQRRPN